MAFYSPDAAMDQRLTALVQRLSEERGEALTSGLSITWLRFPESLLLPERDGQGPAATRTAVSSNDTTPARGASWQGERLRDPGGLVQLPYLIASERWLQRGLLEEEPELRRALRAMTEQGSDDATSYVVDRLSGTTSGPALGAAAFEAWSLQRQLINGWLASLGWPELEGCHAAQKTWQDGPYGREREFFGQALEHANRFNSDGLARLLAGVMAGTLISPPACQRMRTLLSVREQHALAPVLLPAASGWRRFWGKGGGSSQDPALALYGEGEGRDPLLLVLLAERQAGEALAGLASSVVAELLAADAAAA